MQTVNLRHDTSETKQEGFLHDNLPAFPKNQRNVKNCKYFREMSGFIKIGPVNAECKYTVSNFFIKNAKNKY